MTYPVGETPLNLELENEDEGFNSVLIKYLLTDPVLTFKKNYSLFS